MRIKKVEEENDTIDRVKWRNAVLEIREKLESNAARLNLLRLRCFVIAGALQFCLLLVVGSNALL